MDDKNKDRLDKLEKDYPGITSTIRAFDEADLPAARIASLRTRPMSRLASGGEQ